VVFYQIQRITKIKIITAKTMRNIKYQPEFVSSTINIR